MYTFTFIRKDLPLQHQIVQACHSSLEAGAEFNEPSNTHNLVLIQVADLEELESVDTKLTACGFRFHKFFEPDNNLGYTSITTEPLTLEQKKKLSNFKLWRP